MSELDEKLREILDDKGTYLSEQEMLDDIALIKQAFADAGYQKPNEFGQIAYTTVAGKDGKVSIRPAQSDLMTGKDWYERWNKEFDAIHASIESKGMTERGICIEAAKRASGLDT